MKLLTKELIKKFQQVGRQEKVKDVIIIAKFFCPWNQWTWYASEFNKGIFFGYVVGLEKEWGSFSLEELESVKKCGLGIERDLQFKPTKFSELKI